VTRDVYYKFMGRVTCTLQRTEFSITIFLKKKKITALHEEVVVCLAYSQKTTVFARYSFFDFFSFH